VQLLVQRHLDEGFYLRGDLRITELTAGRKHFLQEMVKFTEEVLDVFLVCVDCDYHWTGDREIGTFDSSGGWRCPTCSKKI
jgi:hypothetical protein